MRASDLLRAEVVDETGHRLGTVHDLRVVRSSTSAPWQLQAVVVGATGVAHRLGYATGEVRGPAPLSRTAHRLARRSQVVAWSRVIAYGEGRITVRATDHLGPQ
ncbi:hypothetical protein ACFPM3_15915 [Streptomyces coeruleoprunus]|uniref:PRC-barrel domain-containing protein n=1 Tax=Streptomyces coeruleoprunus TaxID=285563 RepID=A0ABV9XDZ1_9ACTN